MRKVKFKKYNQGVYEPAIGVQLSTGQTRTLVKKAEWDAEFIHEGVFHQWGSAFEDMGEQGAGNYTVALVEDEHGLIHEVLPCNIQFISN